MEKGRALEREIERENKGSRLKETESEIERKRNK